MEKKYKILTALRVFAAMAVWYISKTLSDYWFIPLLEGKIPEIAIMVIGSMVITYTIPLLLAYLIIRGMKNGENNVPSMSLTPSRFIKILVIQCGLSALALIPLNTVIKVMGIRTNAITTEQITSDPLFYMVLLLVFAPVMEEVVFRKLFLDKLLTMGAVPAIVVSALIFAIPHLFSQGPAQVPYTFVLGLIWAYVAIRTKKLWPSILLHSLSNLYCGIIPVYWPIDIPAAAMGFMAVYVIFVPVTAVVLTAINAKEIKKVMY